jgi:hypothetical protein
MGFYRISALAVVAALGLSGAALGQSNTMDNVQNAVSPHVINLTLGEQNKSTQTGTAIVKDVDGGVEVTIALKNEPADASEPAHIHKGTCATLDPAPYKPLTNVVGGASVTTIKGITVADLKAAHYAINVHQSAVNLEHYVACGDL